MTLSELAARIDAHMKQSRPSARAKVSGTGFLCVMYADGPSWRVLDAADGEAYLAWLDAGNVGRHWEMT